MSYGLPADIQLRNLVAKQLRLCGLRRDIDQMAQDWRDELKAVGCNDLERLTEAFRAVRQMRLDARDPGPLTVAGVIATYRGRVVAPGSERSVDGEQDEVPRDPMCSWGCRRGELEMVDPEGYDIVAPCSCKAGEYVRGNRRIYKGRRNVKELRDAGYTVAPAPSPPSWMSDAQSEWVDKVGNQHASGEGGRPFLSAVQAVADKNGVPWPPRTTRRMPGSKPREER